MTSADDRLRTGEQLTTLTLFLQEGLRYSPMRAGLTFAPLGVELVRTLLLPRTATTRSAPAADLVEAKTEELAMFDGVL